ncbi:MAG: cytochrome c oxidase subunit II [Chitinophagaceae bacterium]|nr:cytochrome c oxidase subunit II [Chitinophagaceae bacterium]
MTGILFTLLIILVLVVLYQIGQASELSTILKEEERTNRKRNNWMAYAFLAMLPVLFIFFYYTHTYFEGKLLPESASEHGREYDKMFLTTLYVTGFIFIITQFLLFWFAYKYRDNDKRTPFFFVHSNMLEVAWTTIPAIAMAILVAIGLINWFKMTSEAPANSQVVEVIGKQFNWIMHYPGPDGKMGKRDYQLINDVDNVIGLQYDKDPNAKDDIISTSGELHIEKDRPVKLIIGSRDVIHDVGLPHFRMKMDAVPGIVTTIWFTPLITTEEMKAKTNNPNFVYDISCDQMCGKGHYSMKGLVVVHDKAGIKSWLDGQKSYYSVNHPDAAPSANESADTTAKKISMNTIK